VDGLLRDKTRPFHIPPLASEVVERVVGMTLQDRPVRLRAPTLRKPHQRLFCVQLFNPRCCMPSMGQPTEQLRQCQSDWYQKYNTAPSPAIMRQNASSGLSNFILNFDLARLSGCIILKNKVSNRSVGIFRFQRLYLQRVYDEKNVNCIIAFISLFLHLGINGGR
jgi:hypothetical protein